MNITPKTGTLDTPGARLYFEVRGEGPLVVLVGAPMDARSFEGLADLLGTDHTVLTTDPRGINRSTVADRDADSTPEQRADDLARLITHVDAGPAAILGSSGGAVSVLALAEARPELLDLAIAHEPPLNSLLDDREELYAKTEEIIAAYVSGDVVGSWRLFMKLANIDMPEPLFQMFFGGPRDARTTADELFQYEHMIRPSTRWQPDVERLRALGPKLLVGLGEESSGQLCERTSKALTGLLGTEPTMFPGGHTGFAEDPATFAVRMREVLTGR
ncbi:alpha/beta fold hydrolase [Phytomonospora endophytica]|uniref:Pimeloyl-ACP methyl ester carboxylesterase n=1 Tax=Phytomonospora endophytica TaxID=714109 RepID=A0A841FXC8_9ACTN|nr:alpha/beta hydrolase [Phytomonospora endophytica]MBB6039393.1 pimeloyl-ACP methyl ester carboxylesterase [Phytomonospora endophytica]GIG70120.1 hydrolase [Phytomonospora endophytica]